jgi:tetratricopeptide (TPR) repeat protein
MLRAGSGLCLAAMLLFGASGIALGQSAGNEVARAKQLFDDGKFKESVALLNTYLSAHPADATALVARGDDYQALGNQEAAIGDYSAALAINGQYAYAWASRCDSYHSIDQNQRARSDCDKAIALDPKMAYAYRVRALVELGEDDAQGALADANRALALQPNSPNAFTTRCHTYLVLQKYPESLRDCNSAIAIDPNNDVAYFYRGETEMRLQNWDKAIADLEKDRELDPQETNADYWLAIAFMGKGSYADALKAIDGYIQSDADDADGHLIRASIEAKLGNASEARISATNALKHYMIDNDQTGAAKAQALLNALGGATPSPPPAHR